LSVLPLPAQLKARLTPEAENKDGAPALMTQLLLRGDVVRSVEVFGEAERHYPLPGIGTVVKPPVPGISHGDLRLLSAKVVAKEPQQVNGVDLHWFAPHPLYYESALTLPGGLPAPPDSAFKAHSLRDGAVTFGPQPGGQLTVMSAGRLAGRTVSGAARTPGDVVKTLEPVFDPTKKVGSIPATPPGTDGAFNLDGLPGDFDTGPGTLEDGPYIGLPDFNNGVNQASAQPVTLTPTTSGWFERGGIFGEENGVTYMPWRQASSGFLFGSLPTGVYGHSINATPRPWQTLLLCPNPPSRTTAASQEAQWKASSTQKDHFGFSSPRDHLWLEFFHLPTTEPEGFGDAVSTEGKVNMNYQMMPFTWIERSTAMHGALHGVRLTAIPSTAVAAKDKHNDPINNETVYYKRTEAPASPLQFRYAVDAKKTLEAFDKQRFESGDVFRSASEICDMWLVPQLLEGHTYSDATKGVAPTVPPDSYREMLDWWEGDEKNDPTDGFEATGDNLREAPYAQLYPRLCTKSNVFTVHYRVQLLKKSRSTRPGEWDETRDTVAAEHRGQTTLERYLDLNKKTIPDFATTINEGEALDDYYNIRVVNRRDFKP
ncbi:MAG: Verru_Chthon cassette protein A, partial [Verrucomicrobiaceae bacterium]